MFCPRCGHPNLDDARFCSNCSTRLPQVNEPRKMVLIVEKSPGLAAVLSFFWCGLGQIYNGQILKGLVMLLLYGLSWWLMFVMIGFITTPILWIWGIIDAYRVADRVNQRSALAA